MDGCSGRFTRSGLFRCYLCMGSSVFTLTIAACWIGFNFGGNFALFPLMTSEALGTKNLGQIMAQYSLLMESAVFLALCWQEVSGMHWVPISGPLFQQQLPVWRPQSWYFVPGIILQKLLLNSANQKQHNRTKTITSAFWTARSFMVRSGSRISLSSSTACPSTWKVPQNKQLFQSWDTIRSFTIRLETGDNYHR